MKFGMTTETIRRTIGSQFKSFMKGPFAEMPTDAFDDEGIHVFYKPPGICEALEFHPPSNPSFRGHQFLGTPYVQQITFFQSQDPGTVLEDNGLTSPLFGIDLYAPDYDIDPDALVKAVLVFEAGYFQRPPPTIPA